MAKILTDEEMGQIIHRAIHDPDILDCQDSYIHFLEDLGDLICAHFGGERGNVAPPGIMDKYNVAFHVNECIPTDGGIFKDYDTDVTWKDEMEDGE